MSSNLTGLPPSVLAQLSARNVGQEIAVRLISLPDTLKSADAPTKIAGTVAGQLPNGSLQVQTERGIVTMLLKDRGSLPQGQQIEIEIPAGRNPQQASIRTAAPPPPQQSPQSPYGPPPSLPQTIHASPIAPALRIDRTSPIIPADVQAAIGESSPLEDASLLQGKSLPALQPGLSLRLSPLPGGQQEIAPLSIRRRIRHGLRRQHRSPSFGGAWSDIAPDSTRSDFFFAFRGVKFAFVFSSARFP
jgi:hypothetical protein